MQSIDLYVKVKFGKPVRWPIGIPWIRRHSAPPNQPPTRRFSSSVVVIGDIFLPPELSTFGTFYL